MEFCFQNLLAAVSDALDCVERGLIGVATGHGKRVACMCIYMGMEAGLDERRLSDLAAYALLHDNALTEYIHSEYQGGGTGTENALALHCLYGERNMKGFPFFHPVEGAVLYHHENADGSGPFGKRTVETPDYARWVHLADQLDAKCGFRNLDEGKYEKARTYVQTARDKEFASQDVTLFLKSVTYEKLAQMQQEVSTMLLDRLLPHIKEDIPPERFRDVGALFARVVDYKSTFTSLHSQGIAEKAYEMGKHYGYSEEKSTKLFLAGALHDLGKLAVDTEILEKPGRLTDEEYTEMQQHAVITFDLLSSIEGFEEIARWASRHHEKLDGTGYPWGYSAADLSREERLLACLDIYQALMEPRPYKPAKTHAQVIAMMRSMGQGLDQQIVEDIYLQYAPRHRMRGAGVRRQPHADWRGGS